MRFRIILSLLGTYLGMMGVLYAQTEEEGMLIEQLVDLHADVFTEDFDFNELSEQLAYFRRYPINLNQTDGQDLARLGFLSPLLIQRLLAYRDESGDFISLLELQTIEGFDIRTAEFLSLFVTTGGGRSLQGVRFNDFLREGEHDLMLRYGRILEKQRGYDIDDPNRSHYLGSPDRLFVRYRYRMGRDFQLSINMKKDPGEQFFSGAQRYGFDFYSASLLLKNQGKIRSLVLGDYALQFGQGLAMWNGLAFGKGAMMQSVARQSHGLRPYTSANEFLFLRGAAATIDLGRIAVTPFVSYRRLTGSVQTASDSALVVGSLGQTGLHRTPTEAANRHALQQWVYGVNVAYQQRNLTLGGTLFRTSFSGDIVPQPLLRNRYAFSGSSLTNTSIYYNYGLRNFHFFGEGAYQLGRGFAYVNGVLAALTPQISLMMLHRGYQKDYHSFFNQAVAEGSYASNEKGFLSGLVYHPNRSIEWALYADKFRFPWLRYRVDAPSQGTDLLSQFTYTWYKRARITARYRYRLKQENSRQDLPQNQVVDVVRHQIRLHGEYKIGESLTMRNRIEWINYRKEFEKRESGWMVFQDVIYNRMSARWNGNLRIAIFNIPSYDSRVYAFENDVLYGYSFPVYQHTGLRFYTNFRYRIARRVDLWLRYATFIYRDLEQIGSGLDLIEGNKRSDIRVQMRFRF